MHKYLRFFVVPFATLMGILGFLGTYLLISKGFSYSWLGATIASFAPSLFITSFYVRQKGRTTRHVIWVLTCLAAGAALVLTGIFQQEPILWPAILVLGSAVGWYFYSYVYSTFNDRDQQTLAVGNPLPDFNLENVEGKTIPSSSFRGHPSLFVFYRGNWCPLCVAQVKELAGQYRKIKETGTEVYMISPQSAKHTQKMANKFDAPMQFLRDPELAAAKQLGIFHEAGLPLGMEPLGYEQDTVLPTAVITDAAGKIVYSDLTDNYRVRPEPEAFLKILNELN